MVAAIRPQPGPQTEFFQCSADICVYGGGAGGGKTYALLLEAIRHVDNPKFGAVIFRRDSPQITNEGGLWDEAGQIYPMIAGAPRSSVLDYRFTVKGKPGGRVSFRHLEHEKSKYKWQGSQVPLICFDELTHFSESQFFYLLSRNRTTCGVKPYVRATCNPDASSWVKRLLAPWVDRRFKGVKAKSGETRYFIRVKGQITWGLTAEELQEKYPGAKPKSICFIRASVYDNAILLAKDPEYLANLEAQTLVERARLLEGDWDIVNEGLVYPGFGQCVIEAEDWPKELAGKRVGGIDWGFRDPFAALEAIEDVQGDLWIQWERYVARATPTANSKALPRDPDNPTIWWADPSGTSLIAEFRQADHDVRACVHLGSKPIKTGIGAVTDRIDCPGGTTLHIHGDLGNLIDEAGKYRYGEKGDTETPIDRDNHAMDALRYLITGHDRGRIVRDEAPPETEEHRQATEVVALAEREEAEAEYYDQNAEHWWQR